MRELKACKLSQAAMFAMLACAGAEFSTRTPLFIQIKQAPLPILATFITIIAASVSPFPFCRQSSPAACLCWIHLFV